MIVEFIGSSGVGKTTLARALRARDGRAHPTIMAIDLVIDRPGRRWISNPTAVNVAAELTSFPSFLRSFRHDADFVRFAFDRLRRHAPSTFDRYNYMRNIVRKVGVHEMARRASRQATVLVDEGTVLSAYQLFAYSDAPFDRVDLERFARSVPMPDRIVYVRAPLELLVDRAMERSDPRRELARRDRPEVERRIARAVELFEGLAATEPIRDRLLTVDIADDSAAARDAAVLQIEAFLDRPDADGSAEVASAGRPAAGPTTPTERASGRRPGIVIAFVGAEASGKSTILAEVDRWLGQHSRVRRVHAGKPPSTPVTFLPHVLLPALRKVFPEQRSLRVGTRFEGDRPERGTYPLLFGVRSVMLAYERRALLTRAAVWAAEGTIVLSDRYPSRAGRTPDGPQLGRLPAPSGRPSLRRALAGLEDRLYRDIPAPDLIFHLSAPLEVTLARNTARAKMEPEEYVRFRHALSEQLRFDGGRVLRIDTDRELEDVIEEVERAIGDALEIDADVERQ